MNLDGRMGEQSLLFALPKGRLADDALDILARAGLPVPMQMQDEN